MKNNNLNTVKVLFTDSKYNYETSVSVNSTEQTAKEYFVNKHFDLGIYPKEDMQKCIGIKFTDNNQLEINTISQEMQNAINENNKVLEFIKDWQSKNEYNPKFLDEYNTKFNAEFYDFLNAGNFSQKTIDFFTN